MSLTHSDPISPRMDSNPLADIPPARHALESDDEDELDISHFPSQDKENFEIQIRLNTITSIEERRGKPLLIACGDAGRVWAQGARLQQTSQHDGVVVVNNVPFGWIYTPSWAACDYTVLLSEPFPMGEGNEGIGTKAKGMLPLLAMHPYAESILKFLMPCRIILLDTYALPTYIPLISSPKPLYDDTTDHPIRYLTVGPAPFPDNLPLLRFDPPNLLHSTSASFMNVVTFESAAPSKELEAGAQSDSTTESPNLPTPTLLLLLPSPHISPQPNYRPRRVGVGSSKSHLSSPNTGDELYPYPHTDPSSDPSTEWWTPETMRFVENVMFRSLSGDEDLNFERRRGLRWGEELGGGKEGNVRTGKVGVKNMAIGEGGMYI